MNTCCQTAQFDGPPAQLHAGGGGPASTTPPDEDPAPELEPPELDPAPELDPEPELEPPPELDPGCEPELDPGCEPELDPAPPLELAPPELPPELPEPPLLAPPEDEPGPLPKLDPSVPEHAWSVPTTQDEASQARNHPFRMSSSPERRAPETLVNSPNERKVALVDRRESATFVSARTAHLRCVGATPTFHRGAGFLAPQK